MFQGLHRSRHGDTDVVYVVPPSQIAEQWVTKDTYDGFGEPPFGDLPFKVAPDQDDA